MGSALTNYSGNSVSTVTNAPSYGGAQNDMLDFWNSMARRRVMANQAPAARPAVFGARTVATQGPGPATEGNNMDALKQKIMAAQAQKAQAEASAATGRVPTKMTTVGNQSFATPDALAMTGAQRERFLPNNSGQIGSPDEEMSPEDVDFLARMRAGRTGNEAPPRFSGATIFGAPNKASKFF